MVSSATPIIRKETRIKGLPHGVSAEEENRLWGDAAGYLRPRDHKAWLAHFISLEFGLARLLAGWIPACGHLEWKIELPRVLFEGMQHARRLRERWEELPGGNGELPPPPAVRDFLLAIGPADHGASFVGALFHRVLPALARAYRTYQERCDTVYDAPTLYVLRGVLAEKDALIEWGRRFLEQNPLGGAVEAQAALYRSHVDACLRAVNGLVPFGRDAATPTLPANPIAAPAGPFPEKRSNDPRLKLRPDIPNEHKGNPTHGTLLEIVYHDATEWQVVDPMCEIFHGMPGMPFEFFVDFARHTWDECRHSRMGLRRLVELGYDPIRDFEWCAGADRTSSLTDYFLGLTLVGEACSFTRKKGSIPFFLKTDDPRSAMLPEVDCVDEQLHVGFGHKWAPKIFEVATGRSIDHEELTRDSRASILRSILANPGASGPAHAFMSSLDEARRNELINSFSGFCGAIEFKLDLTVR